jgi:hypothetical protein
VWTIRTLVGERCPAAAYTENLGNAQYPPCLSRKFMQIFVERGENMQARLAHGWHRYVHNLFMGRNMKITDEMATRIAYSALAAVDAPRSGICLDEAIRAVKREAAAISSATSSATEKKLEAAKWILEMWDGLIEHQYSGSQKAMSEMTDAAQETAHFLESFSDDTNPRPSRHNGER